MRISAARHTKSDVPASPARLSAVVLGAITGRSGAWLFTIAVAAAAVAVFVAFIIPAPAYDPEAVLPWPLFAVAFALAEVAVVHLMIRNQAISFSLSEIPLVVGFYFAAPSSLIVAQLVGSGVALVLHRRQPPLKIVFNLAIFSLGSSLAILAFRQIAAIAPEDLLVWWIASFVGAVTVVVVSAVAIAIVISVSARRVETGALGRGIALGALTAFVNTSIALVAVVFLRDQPSEIWLLVAPAVVGLLGYRAFSAQRVREARLEFLYACTQILKGPVLDEATLAHLLGRTQEMFRADTVEAVVAIRSGLDTAMRVVIDRYGQSHREVVGPDLVAGRYAMLGAGSEGRLFDDERSVTDAPVVGDPAGMIVPLPGTGDLQGTLMVVGRLDDLSPFGTDDLRVLRTLGSRLGLVAENSALVERLSASLADVTQLATIVQTSEDAIVAVDTLGHITTWNPAAAQLFGYRAEEIVGRVASEVLSGDERDLMRASVTSVFAGAVIRDARMTWARADGTSVPVSITMSPIRRADGEVVGASAIARDESVRARAEAAMAASTELLRSVIDGSPHGMGVAGADRRWIQTNAALRNLLGMTAEQAVGRSAVEHIHPDDRWTIRHLEDHVLEAEPSVRSIERRYVHATGDVVVTQVTARLITDPSTGEQVGLFTIEDITERRRTEEQARATEERFRRAALAISTVQEPEMVFRAVLEAARETLGAAYGAVATWSEDGETITRLEVAGVDPDDMMERVGRRPSGIGVRAAAMRLGRPVRIRDLGASPDFAGFPPGHPPMASFLAVPIPHHGVGSATLYVANKIDDEEFSEADETIAVALATHAAVCLDNARVNAQARALVHDLDQANLELVKASDAKSRFLASVAHELRTPLHAILISSELVHDPPAGPLADGEIRRLGLTIESSGRHMVHLIDDLVDLARIESGRLDIRPTQVMLGDALGEIASDLAHVAEARGISLVLPEGRATSVYADPVRLRQILTNLISNALKFTEAGGGVWVDAVSSRTAIRISVRDTGIGIAPQDLDRAFVAFEQVSGTSTPGAGLGLAISRSLAELHGGTLTVASEPGVGSTFTLTLPRRPLATAATTPKGSIPSSAITVGRGKSILVVEDDPTAMSLTTGVLRMAEYEVWQASGLAEAIAVLEIATPALVLLDVRLGDGSGLELVERLRSDDRRGHLPILIVSADAMPEDVARARASGCDDFLAKPVSPRVMLARIHELVGTSGVGV